MVGGVKIGNRPRPQAIAQRTFLGTFFISPHLSPPSTPTSPGNIEVFKGMQLKVLNLDGFGGIKQLPDAIGTLHDPHPLHMRECETLELGIKQTRF